MIPMRLPTMKTKYCVTVD